MASYLIAGHVRKGKTSVDWLGFIDFESLSLFRAGVHAEAVQVGCQPVGRQLAGLGCDRDSLSLPTGS